MKINLDDLLSRGQRSYSFSNLAMLGDDKYLGIPDFDFNSVGDIAVEDCTGTYYNNYSNDIIVNAHESGITITYANNVTDTLIETINNVYEFEGGLETVFFKKTGDSGKNSMELHLYYGDRWALTARRKLE
ncbi:MAG: hypothetical protein AAGI23_22750 [Bacteroidota bacterium]